MTLFSAAGFVAGSFLAPAMLRILHSSSNMALSLVTAAGGFGLLAYALWHESFPLLVSAAFLFSIGLAPVFTLAADLIVGAAPQERAGSAAALAETSSELGGAMGIAVLGSVVVGLYRDRIGTLLPVDLPTEIQEAVHDSIGATSGAVASLPTSHIAPILGAAQDAFAGAFMAASLVAVLVAAISATAAMSLRSIDATSHDP